MHSVWQECAWMLLALNLARGRNARFTSSCCSLLPSLAFEELWVSFSDLAKPKRRRSRQVEGSLVFSSVLNGFEGSVSRGGEPLTGLVIVYRQRSFAHILPHCTRQLSGPVPKPLLMRYMLNARWHLLAASSSICVVWGAESNTLSCGKFCHARLEASLRKRYWVA